jgi:hypothetical protein
MPSEKVLRPNVCTIEADAAYAEVAGTAGEARGLANLIA